MPISQGRKSHQSQYFKLRSLYLHLDIPHLVLTSPAVSSKSCPFTGHPAGYVPCVETQGFKEPSALGAPAWINQTPLLRCLHSVLQNMSLCSCISSHLTGEAFKHHPQIPKPLVPDPGTYQDPSKKQKAHCLATEVKKILLFMRWGVGSCSCFKKTGGYKMFLSGMQETQRVGSKKMFFLSVWFKPSPYVFPIGTEALIWNSSPL